MRRRFGVLLFFLLAMRFANATTVFWLDPQDRTFYPYAVRREVYTTTRDIEHIALIRARLALQEKAEVKTKDNLGGAATYWTSLSSWITKWGKTNGQVNAPAGDNRQWRDYFAGLSAFQRVRTLMRTTALIKASLSGMTFEVNAWKMLKNIQFEQMEEFTTSDGTVVKRPLGVVTLSIVPRGKGTLDKLKALYNDDPAYPSTSGVKIIGPRHLGDLALAADYTQPDELKGTPVDQSSEWLEYVDRSSRAAAESMNALMQYTRKRSAQASADQYSPRELADRLKEMAAERVRQYGALAEMRALMEGRSPEDILAEYNQETVKVLDEAKTAYVNAEMSAAFYGNLQKMADNAVSELELPDYQKNATKGKDDFLAAIGDWNKAKVGVDTIKEVAATTAPILLPFSGTPFLPAMPVATEALEKKAEDSNTPGIGDQLRIAQAKVYTARFSRLLYRELKATRTLLWIEEMADVADEGTRETEVVADVYAAQVNALRERGKAIQKFKAAAQLWDQTLATGSKL